MGPATDDEPRGHDHASFAAAGAMSGDGVILVGGEALFDVVASDGEDLKAHPGGGPFNASRTIARLEQPVAYLGRLSTDRFGDRLERILLDDGVSLQSVVRTEDPTTLALAELGEGGSVARYRFYAQGTSAAGLTSEAALAALPERVEALLLGTLGLVLEPMASALEAVLDRLAGSALVAIDPNCRPDVIPDPAAYRRRLAWILQRADLLKVSEEDVAWLYPDRDPLEATRALLAGGPAGGGLTPGDARAARRRRGGRRPPPGRRRRRRDHGGRRGRGRGAAHRGRRHDRRRRRLRRRAARLVARAGLRAGRPGRPRRGRRGRAVRLPRRGEDLRARRRLAPVPQRALRRPAWRSSASSSSTPRRRTSTAIRRARSSRATSRSSRAASRCAYAGAAAGRCSPPRPAPGGRGPRRRSRSTRTPSSACGG